MWSMVVTYTVKEKNCSWHVLELQGKCGVRCGKKYPFFIRIKSERPEKRIPEDVAALRHIINIADNTVAERVACTETVFPCTVQRIYSPVAWCAFRNIYTQKQTFMDWSALGIELIEC